MNDFTGFSFNGIHSSQLGIVRVSDGDRYNEVLHPEIEDKYNTIPGGDGAYYFGSQYRIKSISISIAFDSVTEEQFRHIVRLFSTKQVCSLIFDERPYKVYAAKLAQPAQLNYICFDEPKRFISLPQDGVRVVNRIVDEETSEITIEREQVTPYVFDDDKKERIYKGEGTLEFICTYPFAREQFKILDQYGPFDTFYNHFGEQFSYDDSIPIGNAITTYTNINEWAAASGILAYQEYDKWKIDTVLTDEITIPYSYYNNGELVTVEREVEIPTGYNAYIPVYNPGDKAAPFFLFLPYYIEDGVDITTTKGKLQGTNLISGENGYNIIINNQNELMIIQPFEANTTYDKENGIIINTRNHLIEGVKFDAQVNAWTTTGNLYNWNILAGDFSDIKMQDWSLDWRQHGQSICLNCATAAGARIFYNYIYY